MKLHLLFDNVYKKAIKNIVSEADIASTFYSDSNRHLSRQNRSNTLIFRFYNAIGEEEYIIPWENTGGYITPSVDRLTDEFLATDKATKMDERNRNYLVGNIMSSLRSFDKKKLRAQTREEILRKSPYNAGRIVDTRFDYFAWELINRDTGETYAWALHSEDADTSKFHIGQNMPSNIFSKLDNSKAESNTGNDTLAKFEFYFYDDNDVNTYIIPFEPKGEYSLKRNEWKILSNIKISEMKAKTQPSTMYLIKFVKDALEKTLDGLISLSDIIVPNDEKEEYPIHGIDNDFYYNKWKLTRNGEDFCYGTKSTSYPKYGTPNW